MPKKMPNAKVLVDGKWIAYVSGSDGVKSVFAGDKGELVVLGEDSITTFIGCPYVLERDYKKEDKAK